MFSYVGERHTVMKPGAHENATYNIYFYSLQPNCDIKSGSSIECLAPRLDLNQEAIQWLNQSEQQRDDSGGRRRKCDVWYDVDTSSFHRLRRQAPSDQRVEEDRVLDQETGVRISVQVFFDHGDEARNETLEAIVNLPTFQPADINDPPVNYKHNVPVILRVCL